MCVVCVGLGRGVLLVRAFECVQAHCARFGGRGEEKGMGVLKAVRLFARICAVCGVWALVVLA